MTPLPSFACLLAVLVSSLLAAGPSLAQEAVSAQTAKRFDVALVITPETDSSDAWTMALTHGNVAMRPMDRVYAGQRYHVKLFFLHYATDAQSQASLDYDLTIRDPLGNVYFSHHGIPGYEGPISDASAPILAKRIISITHDPTESLGRYSFEVTARDRIANTTMARSTKVELSKLQADPVFSSSEAYQQWVQFYYQRPNPGALIPALLHHAKLQFDAETPAERGVFLLESGFFQTAFEKERWLLPHLAFQYEKAELPQKKKIIFLLLLLGLAEDEFFGRVEEELTPFVQKWSQFSLIARDTRPESPHDLDILWGRFFATGSPDIIANILGGLRLAGFRRDAAAPEKTSPPPGEQERRRKGMTFEATRWSLAAQCQRHPLVRHYCAYLHLSGSIDLAEELWLGTILQSLPAEPARTEEKSSPKGT